MTQPQAQVQTIKELATFNATGQTVRTYVVSFTVGDQGPFTVSIPSDQFNAANVQAAMQKFADEINKLIPGA